MKIIHGLHKDTLININGNYQKIGDIKVDDVVKGFDIHGVGARDNKVVSVRTSTIDSHIEFILSDGSKIKSSIDAKVLTLMGEWVSPINVYNTQKELHNDLHITALRYIEESLDIVSIEVEPDHNFYVGQLLFHNTGPTGPPGPTLMWYCSTATLSQAIGYCCAPSNVAASPFWFVATATSLARPASPGSNACSSEFSCAACCGLAMY